LLKGLVQFILHVFKQITDFLEYVLFSVEEWLRFRAGDHWLSQAVRATLGLIWFPVAWFIRFYTVVLLEPGFNPIKFPIASLAAKFVYPLALALNAQNVLVDFLQPVLGYALAYPLVVGTLWLSPDLFAFLFWEVKENWSLYQANRSRTLRPVSVGPHGETLKGLLQPGFHSGTVPRVYTRLRKAERLASHSGDWHSARSYRHELEEIANCVKRFVARELVGLLRQSQSWQGHPIEVGSIYLATNRIHFELVHPATASRPIVLEVERAGHRWLAAHIEDRGWLEELGPEPLRAFTTALAGWYKLAGVDLVREQVRGNLPPAVVSFDVIQEGLLVKLAAHQETAVYPLGDPTVPVVEPNGPAALGLPALDPEKLVFARIPVFWDQWVACWARDQDSGGNPGLPGGLNEQLVWTSAPAPPPAAASGPTPTTIEGVAV
jgi:hypothetical protein